MHALCVPFQKHHLRRDQPRLRTSLQTLRHFSLLPCKNVHFQVVARCHPEEKQLIFQPQGQCSHQPSEPVINEHERPNDRD